MTAVAHFHGPAELDQDWQSCRFFRRWDSGDTELAMIAATGTKSAAESVAVDSKTKKGKGRRTATTPSKYDFSEDYVSHNVPLYKKYLKHLKGEPCRLLEIGSFEGRSTT